MRRLRCAHVATGERYAVRCRDAAYMLSPEHLFGQLTPAVLATRDVIEREVEVGAAA